MTWYAIIIADGPPGTGANVIGCCWVEATSTIHALEVAEDRKVIPADALSLKDTAGVIVAQVPKIAEPPPSLQYRWVQPREMRNGMLRAHDAGVTFVAIPCGKPDCPHCGAGKLPSSSCGTN